MKKVVIIAAVFGMGFVLAEGTVAPATAAPTTYTGKYLVSGFDAKSNKISSLITATSIKSQADADAQAQKSALNDRKYVAAGQSAAGKIFYGYSNTSQENALDNAKQLALGQMATKP